MRHLEFNRVERSSHRMGTMTFTRIAVGATLLATFWGAAASAEPGVLADSVYLRQGPGWIFEVVGRVRAGATVDIGQCLDLWCEISRGNQHGYVEESSIVPAAALPPIGPTPQIVGTAPPPPGYDGPVLYPAPYANYYAYTPYYGQEPSFFRAWRLRQ